MMPPGHIVEVDGEWTLKMGPEWMNGPFHIEHYKGRVVYSANSCSPVGYYSENWIKESAEDHSGIIIEVDREIECWTLRDFNTTNIFEGGWYDGEIEWDCKLPDEHIKYEQLLKAEIFKAEQKELF